MRRLVLALGLMLGMAHAVNYSEPQRLRIWLELSAADARASWAADATYPEGCHSPVALMRQHAALSDKLAEKWQQVVVRKYKLTRRQVTDLLYEGSDKGWPEASYPPKSC